MLWNAFRLCVCLSACHQDEVVDVFLLNFWEAGREASLAATSHSISVLIGSWSRSMNFKGFYHCGIGRILRILRRFAKVGGSILIVLCIIKLFFYKVQLEFSVFWLLILLLLVVIVRNCSWVVPVQTLKDTHRVVKIWNSLGLPVDIVDFGSR